MSEHFDPYHRWLGIPRRHQPADRYRLLGIDRFENDPEVIADAAERQTAHVRRYQHGPHSDLSQRVLNDLAAAKACLLDPDEKAEYDRKLRESIAEQEPARAGGSPPAVEPVPPVNVASSLSSDGNNRGHDAVPAPASPRVRVGPVEPAIGAPRAVHDPRLSEHFDPHHRWLGIPPKHQPADHYRLLGLAQFEDDPEVIGDAAERQITHVRGYQLGPHSDLSQRILNELAAAKACLLTPAKKAEYDRTLREQVAAQEQGVPPPAPPSPAVLPPVVVPPQARSKAAEGGEEPPAHPPAVRRPWWVNRAWLPMEVRPHVLRVTIMTGAVGGGILLGLVLVLFWRLFAGGDGPEIAVDDAGTAFVVKGLEGERKPGTPARTNTQPKTSEPADPAPAGPGLAIQPAVPPAVEPTTEAKPDRTPVETETPVTEAKPAETSKTVDSSQPTVTKPAEPPASPAMGSARQPPTENQVSEAARPAVPLKPTPMASEAPQDAVIHAFAGLTEFSVEVVVGGDPKLRRSKFATGLGILAGLMRSTLQASVEVIDLKVVEKSDRAVMVVVMTPSMDWPYLVLNLAAELKCITPNGGEAIVVWSANSQSNWKDGARGVCRLDAARLDAHKDPIIRNAMVLDFHKVWEQSVLDFFRPLGIDHRAARIKLDALPGLAPAVQGLEPTLPSDNTQSVEPEFTNSIGMKFKLIPAGKFLMGSPESEPDRRSDHLMGSPESEPDRRSDETQHQVRITKPYYMGVYEVTQGEYERVMVTNPSWFSRTGDGKDKISGQDTSRFPVDSVSWEDAVEFSRMLESMPREQSSGRTYRLPTEAEWEYACRAGTETPFHFGSQLNGREANCNGTRPYGTTGKGPYLACPTTVGSYAANRFGVYDMHGSVWEWCQDVYDADYYRTSPKDDPEGPKAGSSRVLRGGAWSGGGSLCRSAYRGDVVPACRSYDVGFRLVLSVFASHP